MTSKLLLLAGFLALVGCATNTQEPTADEIGTRLQSEYAGVSLAVFASRNGSPKEGVPDPASKTTFYEWQVNKLGDDDYCQVSIRVATDTNVIQQITVLGSGQNQIDTFWFFHHKYVDGCKQVK